MEGHNKLVRRFYKCSNCKIFNEFLINPLIPNLNCSKCHLPLKEMSENEFQDKKKKLKEIIQKRNEAIYQQNNNPNRINIHIPSSNQNEQKGNRDKNRNNRNEGNPVRGNSSLHFSTLNMNNINDKEEKKNDNYNNWNNNINNNNINIQQNHNNNHHHHHNPHIRIIIHNKGGGNHHNNRRREHSSERNNHILHHVLGNILNPFSNMNNNPMIMVNNINRNPFRIIAQRQNVSPDIFDPFFSNFGSVFGGAFQDNFSSNFRSNFRGNFMNEILRVLEHNRRQKHPPTNEETLNKLKKFNMNEKYCKKDKDGNIEMPNCSICMDEIALRDQTILLPCGHMYHSNCILTWLKQNNTCPMCRFEIK